MPDDTTPAELDLTDAELMEVLKNHGIDRRGVMKALGVGAGVTTLSGATAGTARGDARIDDVFGASYAADESPPPGLVDHTVELRGPPGNDIHSGFPKVDTREDGDFKPDKEVSEFFFDPVGIRVQPGDVVEFTVIEDHEHTASAFAEKFELPSRIPDVAGFSSPPIVGDESWLFRFDTIGTYDLVCLPHLVLGMAMRIVVGDGGDDYGGLTDPPGPGNPFANADTVLTAPELTPDTIVSEGAIAWADLTL